MTLSKSLKGSKEVNISWPCTSKNKFYRSQMSLLILLYIHQCLQVCFVPIYKPCKQTQTPVTERMGKYFYGKCCM